MTTRALLLVLTAGSLLAAGCGEERRAWVSILPAGDDDEEAATAEVPAGALGISPDGLAVLLGEDTLFTVHRLPSPGSDAMRFHRAAFSPDSSLVAFVTAGASPAVGIWSRPGQTGWLMDASPGGQVDSLAWAPEGRFLAWEVRSADGLSRVSIADPAGRRMRHPVPAALALDRRSVSLQGWIDPSRARVLVAAGARPEAGLAYVWDAVGSNFVLESHIDALVQLAPPAPPAPGGVFSLDLLGDGAPETVALYRSAEGAPGVLVLESREEDFRARNTEPLLEPGDVGLERWQDAAGGPGLYAPVRMGGETLLLLKFPSAERGVTTVGAFVAGADGALSLARVEAPAGALRAIFQDGQVGNESRQLGLVDLDDDGSPELISASGSRVDEGGIPSVRWQVTVLGWRGGGLVPLPELKSAALARIARATGPAIDPRIGADTTAGAP